MMLIAALAFAAAHLPLSSHSVRVSGETMQAQFPVHQWHPAFAMRRDGRGDIVEVRLVAQDLTQDTNTGATP